MKHAVKVGRFGFALIHEKNKVEGHYPREEVARAAVRISEKVENA